MVFILEPADHGNSGGLWFPGGKLAASRAQFSSYVDPEVVEREVALLPGGVTKPWLGSRDCFPAPGRENAILGSPAGLHVPV